MTVDPVEWARRVREWSDQLTESYRVLASSVQKTLGAFNEVYARLGKSRDELEQAEIHSRVRFRSRIALEREIGLDYVRNEANRVRRELGLEEK